MEEPSIDTQGDLATFRAEVYAEDGLGTSERRDVGFRTGQAHPEQWIENKTNPDQSPAVNNFRTQGQREAAKRNQVTPSQTSEKHHVFLRKTKSVQLLRARYIQPGLLSKHRHMQVLEQKVMQ